MRPAPAASCSSAISAAWARAWDLGLVGLCQFAPALLLALLADHVIDTHHRGCILALCLGVRAAIALAPVAAAPDFRRRRT